MADRAQRLKELGDEAMRKKVFDSAAALYTLALTWAPTTDAGALAELHSARAGAHMSLRDPRRALADGEMCVRLAPGWAKGYSRKAAALVELRRYAEAGVVYEAGLAAEPGLGSLTVLPPEERPFGGPEGMPPEREASCTSGGPSCADT